MDEAVNRTWKRQALGAVTEGLGNLIPSGGIVSGMVGSTIGAAGAPGIDHSKVVADQQVGMRQMAERMERMARQANEAMPDTVRLQHLNELQAKRGCQEPALSAVAQP